MTMFGKPVNDFATTLAAPHAIGDGALSLASAAGLGALAADEMFRVTVGRNFNTPSEVVEAILAATGIVGTTLTGVVGAEGYADVALASGRDVEVRVTAGTVSELQDAARANAAGVAANAAGLASHVADTANPHAVTASQVGASVAQWNANALQGKAVSTTAPTDTQILSWDAASSSWKAADRPTATPGGTVNQIQFNSGSGGFAGSVARVTAGGAANFQKDPGAFNGGPYACLVLGDLVNGETDGGVFSVAANAAANQPFTVFGGFDSPASTGRFVYFGGGGWGTPDPNYVLFFTAPTYDQTPNGGLLRIAVHPAGNVSVNPSAFSSPPDANAALGVRPLATTGKALVLQGLAGQTGNLLEIQDSSGAPLGGITAAGDFIGGGSALTGVVHATGDETIADNKTFTGRLFCSFDDATSSTANPAQFGGVGSGVAYASRLLIDSGADCLQAGAGQRTQLASWWGTEIRGNRQGDPPAFVAGSPSDPSLTVVGSTAAAPVLRAVAAAGQAGNTVEVVSSDGVTVLAHFDATGNLSAPVRATGTTTARRIEDRASDWFHSGDFATVGDDTADDTAAIQAWLDACALAGAKAVWDRPPVAYRVTDTLLIRPPNGGAQVHMDMEGLGAYPGLIRWAGGDNKPVFRAVGWQLSTIKNVNITIPASASGVIAWDLDNTAVANSLSVLDFANCRVDLGTGATSCVGWRLGHGTTWATDGLTQGSADISFITWINCTVFGQETGGGNRGWSSEHQNVVILDLVDCYAMHVDRFVSNVPTAGAAAPYGGSSIDAFGCGTSHCLVDYEYGTAGAYLISGGRYEEGGTSFLSVPNGGANSALSITVSGTEIDAYDGLNVFDLRSSVALILDGVAASPNTTLHGSGFIRLETTAGGPGSVTATGCTFGATAPFHTVVSGDWTVHRDGCLLVDLTGGATGKVDDTTTALAAKADDAAAAHTAANETITGAWTFANDLNIDASASTQSAVRQFSFTGGGSTAFASRIGLAGAAYYLQAGFGTRFQMGAYWGVVIAGNRQADPPAFEGGGPTDPSLTVVGATVGAPVLRVAAASGQTGDTLEITASDRATVLASFDASGHLKVGGTQVVGAQGAAVADATNATDVITQLNALLARLRAHGLIAT